MEDDLDNVMPSVDAPRYDFGVYVASAKAFDERLSKYGEALKTWQNSLEKRVSGDSVDAEIMKQARTAASFYESMQNLKKILFTQSQFIIVDLGREKIDDILKYAKSLEPLGFTANTEDPAEIRRKALVFTRDLTRELVQEYNELVAEEDYIANKFRGVVANSTLYPNFYLPQELKSDVADLEITSSYIQ
jgi:hypothetical protein